MPTTGEEAWKYQIEDQIRCSPTIVEGRAFLAGCDGKLHVIDLDKGEAIGSVPIESPTGSTPAVLGRSRLLRHARAARSFAINWKKQEIVVGGFKIAARQLPIRSSAAVTQRGGHFGGHDKQVHALDPKTGQAALEVSNSRRRSIPRRCRGRPAVYFGSADGRVYGLNRTTGEKEWEYEAGGRLHRLPAVADGRLVIASDDGRLYCFGTK